ncbi:hypothetical protein [Streptococcus sciuri]|uniref:Uncharacterized protein n=1 Tax=Streptococcus sciuri TaxID=2973939 RepID=A0ABT2F856_9STRE|nr:hypothetical protein [Streptococcus sciuri]MCS4488658.1 hypothetical protein [Streptococcus sciuri]
MVKNLFSFYNNAIKIKEVTTMGAAMAIYAGAKFVVAGGLIIYDLTHR